MNHNNALNIQISDEKDPDLQEKLLESAQKPEIKGHKVRKWVIDMWHNVLDIDPYYLGFKQIAPLIPLIPATYEIIDSMINDRTNNTLANWFKIIDVFQNINIYLYGIFSTILYVIFKKSKRMIEFMHTRRKYACRIRSFNKGFLIFMIAISVIRFIMGCFLPGKDSKPFNISSQIFVLNLFAQLAVVIFEIFYLYSVFIKKFYKFEEELDEIASWGIKNPENFKKNFKSSILKKYIEKQRDLILAEKLQKQQEDHEHLDKEFIKVNKKVWDYLQRGKNLNQKLLDHVKALQEQEPPCQSHSESIQSRDELSVKCMRHLLEDLRIRAINAVTSVEFELKVRLCHTIRDIKLLVKDQLGLPQETSKITLKVEDEELNDDNSFLFEYDMHTITQHLKVYYPPEMSQNSCFLQEDDDD